MSRYTVWYTTIVLLVALEHAVLLAKVLVKWLVPRRPQWVAHAEARAAFLAQRARDKARDARQSAVQLPEEPGDMPGEEQAPLRRAAAAEERHDAAIRAAKGRLGDIEAAVNARLAEADCTPELPRGVELVEQRRQAPDPTPRRLGRGEPPAPETPLAAAAGDMTTPPVWGSRKSSGSYDGPYEEGISALEQRQLMRQAAEMEAALSPSSRQFI